MGFRARGKGGSLAQGGGGNGDKNGLAKTNLQVLNVVKEKRRINAMGNRNREIAKEK